MIVFILLEAFAVGFYLVHLSVTVKEICLSPVTYNCA